MGTLRLTGSAYLYLAVALGGALGSVARYLLAGWLGARAGGSFPWGTWVVNLGGTFLLGFFYTLALERSVDPLVRTGVATGFLGAFTTFSTLNLEAWGLLTGGAWWPALLYLASSWLLGLVAFGAGLVAARSFPVLGVFVLVLGAALGWRRATVRGKAAARGIRAERAAASRLPR